MFFFYVVDFYRVVTRPGNLENLELSGNSDQPGKVMDFFESGKN